MTTATTPAPSSVEGHFVPLAPEALAVLNEAAAIRRVGSDHIFPNGNGVALSDMALTKTLRLPWRTGWTRARWA